MRTFLYNTIPVALATVAVALFLNTTIGHTTLTATGTPLPPTTQVASVPNATAAENPPSAVPTTTPEKDVTQQAQSAVPLKETPSEEVKEVAKSGQIQKIESPYTSAPVPTDTLNTTTRAALVNILCIHSGKDLSSISGSGIIIDSRGVILTNAHIAQYVLLSEHPGMRISCSIRTGSPARPAWHASVLFMPTTWVTEHAKDISIQEPKSTGENDYALLYIDKSITTAPLPETFPFIQPDTREGIGFPGDIVLVASYPAGFLGSLEAQNRLGALSTIATIRQLYAFSDTHNADAFSLGGIILAQNGSSGGAVVNAWGKLVGLIVTSSAGATTAERDLRALSLAHINRSIIKETGSTLSARLSNDPVAQTAEFTRTRAQVLIGAFLDVLSTQ